LSSEEISLNPCSLRVTGKPGRSWFKGGTRERILKMGFCLEGKIPKNKRGNTDIK
jgi:hypothetical protein